MILGQLRIWARATTYAALTVSKCENVDPFFHWNLILWQLTVLLSQVTSPVLHFSTVKIWPLCAAFLPPGLAHSHPGILLPAQLPHVVQHLQHRDHRQHDMSFKKTNYRHSMRFSRILKQSWRETKSQFPKCENVDLAVKVGVMCRLDPSGGHHLIARPGVKFKFSQIKTQKIDFIDRYQNQTLPMHNGPASWVP